MRKSPRIPGWQADSPPPSGFTGSSPPRRVAPEAKNGPPSPFLTKPRSSMVTMAMYVNAS
jgi:hypothetical protein